MRRFAGCAITEPVVRVISLRATISLSTTLPVAVILILPKIVIASFGPNMTLPPLMVRLSPDVAVNTVATLMGCVLPAGAI